MRSERGFTLVEALIAFAILAIVLVALYETMGTSVSGIGRAGRLDEAVLIAESRLAEIEALRTAPQGEVEGSVEGTAYRWRIEPVADATPEPPEFAASPLRLQKIKLRVLWREGEVKREVVVERLLLVQRQPGN
jgi:general secretion pathway protein I